MPTRESLSQTRITARRWLQVPPWSGGQGLSVVPESEATELFAECRRCVKRINSLTGQTSRASDIKGAARPWVSANLCQTTHHAESGLLEDTPSTATHGG